MNTMLAVVDKIVFKVASEFTTTPGPRSEKEGSFSGQTFRTKFLAPAIKKAIAQEHILVVDLDGSAGYGTSFLEESFGGLIRNDRISYEALKEHLEIISDEEPYLVEDIEEYLKDANQHK